MRRFYFILSDYTDAVFSVQYIVFCFFFRSLDCFISFLLSLLSFTNITSLFFTISLRASSHGQRSSCRGGGGEENPGQKLLYNFVEHCHWQKEFREDSSSCLVVVMKNIH